MTGLVCERQSLVHLFKTRIITPAIPALSKNRPRVLRHLMSEATTDPNEIFYKINTIFTDRIKKIIQMSKLILKK